MDEKETIDQKLDIVKHSLRAIKSDVELAIVVSGIAMIGSCLSCDRTNEIRDYLHPKLQQVNVIGNPAPDKFYEIDGKKVYLEIDGKPVAEYFPQKNQ